MRGGKLNRQNKIPQRLWWIYNRACVGSVAFRVRDLWHMRCIEIEKGKKKVEKDAQRPIFNLPRNRESYRYCCYNFTVNVIKDLVIIRLTFSILNVLNGSIPPHLPSPILSLSNFQQSPLNISFAPLSRYPPAPLFFRHPITIFTVSLVSTFSSLCATFTCSMWFKSHRDQVW